MITAALTVNGRAVSGLVEPRMHLGDFLREQLRLTGTHLACEHGVCGACTVVVDGLPVRSCITLVATCDGADIRTIEGFDDDATMEKLRDAFSREHGLQCGFCTPGMLIAARDIVLRVPDADDKRIRDELSGNLCRCTGYLGIVRAVGNVIESNRTRRPDALPSIIERTDVTGNMVRFSPIEVIPDNGPTTVPRQAGEQKGWTTFEDSVVIDAPPDKVWKMLADFAIVASCLPGAKLTNQDGNTAKGSLSIKLGPISATFIGSAVVERDETGLVCLVKGAGGDGVSRSRTRGELAYRVASENGEKSARVFIDVRYNLQGPLAQFSRSGITLELGRRLLVEFATNLNARLGHENALESLATPTQLDTGRLLLSAIRVWAKSWFRSEQK